MSIALLSIESHLKPRHLKPPILETLHVEYVDDNIVPKLPCLQFMVHISQQSCLGGRLWYAAAPFGIDCDAAVMPVGAHRLLVMADVLGCQRGHRTSRGFHE